MATDDHAPFDWRSWLLPLLALLGLLGFAYAAGSVAWDWVNRYAAVKALDGKDFVVAKLDVVKLSLSSVAGGGALYALYLAHRRQRTAEQDLRDRRTAQRYTELDADERRVTELYTKAADQVGSDKPAVRLAGLYALERLAQTAVGQRQTIVNVLCAYLRMPFELPVRVDPDVVDLNSEEGERLTKLYVDRVQEREVRLAAQHILTTHLRPSHEQDYWGMHEPLVLDLTGAVLLDFNVTRCFIGRAKFRDAILVGESDFNSAIFDDYAEFAGASFVGSGRPDDGAMFLSTIFNNGARFDDATFEVDVHIGDGAIFRGAVSFSNVRFLAVGDFSGCAFGGPTTFETAAFGLDALFTATRFKYFGPTFVDVAFAAGVNFAGASIEGSANLTGAWVEFSEGLPETAWHWPDGWGLGPFDLDDPGTVRADLVRVEMAPAVQGEAS